MLPGRLFSRAVAAAFGVLALFHGWVQAAPAQIAIVSDRERVRDPADEWAWALRGGGADLLELPGATLAGIPETIKLIIIDDIPLTRQAQRLISDWTKAGGLLIVSGADAALQTRLNAGTVRRENDFSLRDI
ncbi:MAG: hypothetical protein WAK53_03165, partial [Chromatiaceae bacterium]